MQKNYYLFMRQAAELDKELQDYSIKRIFSFKKQEVTFHLCSEDERYLQIGYNSAFPYFYSQPAFNIKQPKVILWQALQNRRIKRISIIPQERILVLTIGDFRVWIFLFGANPGLALADDQQHIIDKISLPKKYQIPEPRNLSDLFNITLEEVQNIFSRNSGKVLSSLIKALFPSINTSMLREITFRAGIEGSKPVDEIPLKKTEDLYNVIQDAHIELQSGAPEIVMINQKIAHLCLLHYRHLEKDALVEFKKYGSVNEAWPYFIRQQVYGKRYDALHNLCRKALYDKKEYIDRSYQKLIQYSDLVERKKEAELKGNLLLTFLRQVPRGASKVELENIFSGNREKIEIKLNPAHSAAVNAEKYFNKFKDLEKETTTLKLRRETFEFEQRKLNELMLKLKKADSLKELEKLHQLLADEQIIKNQTGGDKVSVPRFKRVLLDEKWALYIGRSGQKNDQLTFGFARPFDYWFHAQGVPGAHVVLRVPNKDSQPANHIIQKAAGVAAYYSKYKNEQHVPVIYTSVRYVSRIRKAPPGTVKVQRETVIFVDPIAI